MHQYTRPPHPTASPAASEQTNPTRTNNPRDPSVQHSRSTSIPGAGPTDDFVNTKQEASIDNPSAQMQRLNQVIQNFHTKAALIILHSRVDLPEAYSTKSSEKRVNRWFNIELDETEEYSDSIRRWRKCDVTNNRPPPMVIEIYLTTEGLAPGQRLVLLDEDEKRWDVTNALEASLGKNKRKNSHNYEVLLERWTIQLGEPTSSRMSTDLTSILPLVYKKSIVLFRSLYTYCNFLPAWKLSRKVGKSRANMAMKLGYRIVDGFRLDELSRPDNLTSTLCDSATGVTTNYSFGETESPAGPFSVEVQYRENCDFRIDDTEELLSSRFLGVEEDLFKPSVPRNEQSTDERTDTHAGSLPADRRGNLVERPELGHAYGSLSTFHQAGFSAGTSPISALRGMRELGQPSPSPEQTRPGPQPLIPTSSQRNTLRAAAAERRSSISFSPFKAPTLSASPLGASPLGTSPRTSTTRVPALSSLQEESNLPPPNAQAVAARKTGSLASETTVPSSAGSSPKPQPVRYSSSFSHRRVRQSSGGGGAVKIEEDQISSGRASAASSTAPPGSGLMTEAAAGTTSSGSMQEDDENISDFLKMLDTKKDLLTPADAAASEASTRRTAAALNRFHRMRDSNAALSDSMSSSLVMNKSSAGSSRQIAGAPVSTSTSPNKPISPHTPHTPFAPSRLSAAYSHDDDDHRHNVGAPEGGNQENFDGAGNDEPRVGTVPAIDIPNSPQPFLPGYQRSGSSQRRPISSSDASEALNQQEPENFSLHQTATGVGQIRSTRAGVGVSEPGYNPSLTQQIYRSRSGRGGSARGITPPQGSTSSFGGTGGSLERGLGSTGSVSESWGDRRGRFRSGSRPDHKPPSGEDADEEDGFFPFAMEKSDFNQRISER